MCVTVCNVSRSWFVVTLWAQCFCAAAATGIDLVVKPERTTWVNYMDPRSSSLHFKVLRSTDEHLLPRVGWDRVTLDLPPPA